MESKEYTKKKGNAEASLLVYKDGNKLSSVCCGVVCVGGNTAASIIMDDYGLRHDYEGDSKSNVDTAVKNLQSALVKDFGLVFAERPVQEGSEMHEPVETQEPTDSESNEESISSSEVGSVESVLGDIL